MDYNGNSLIMGIVVYLLGLFLIFAGIFLLIAEPVGDFIIGGGMWLVIPGYFLLTTGNTMRKRAMRNRKSRHTEAKEVLDENTYSYSYEQKEESMDTERCPGCDHENPVGSSTCENCGTQLADLKKCQMCGKLNPSDSKFCRNCGHDFELDS